jgi:uncharacterized protein DUF3854
MIYEESTIARDVARERGTFTARRGREVPQDHGWLPRKPGVVFPVHTLEGEIFHRLRPDNPGRLPKYLQPKGHPNRLDVHPRQHERIRQSGGMRYVTEGEKKVDAGVSRGLLMVGMSGVWNGQKDKRLIPDWDLLPLAGEDYSIAPDSDIETNQSVQSAVERQARLLRERGANVFVTLLPPAPDGSKQGLDDFFANGGTVEQLELLTTPYDATVVERIRLSRDERLRADLGYLLRAWHDGDWMRFRGTADKGNWQRGHTARDVMGALIGLAAKIGKPDARGVVVEAGLRRISRQAAKSAPSVGDAMKHLEADGQIKILPATGKGKPRRYRLLVPSAALYSMEKGHAKKTEFGEGDPKCKGLRYPSASRLRWASPARSGRLVRRMDGLTRRIVTEAVGDNVFVEPDYRPYAKRLGPHRGAVLDILEAAGGEMHLKDLCEALHRKRPWDVRRRILKPLEEAGIIEMEGDAVRLAHRWQAKLEERREKDGEIEQAEKQAQRHRADGERYLMHLQRQKHGTPRASIEAVRRTHEARDRRLREIREEEERDRAPSPPAVELLVSRIVGQHERVRMGLLCEIAAEEGLRWRDVPPAVRRMGYRVERLPEYGDVEFIYADRRAA